MCNERDIYLFFAVLEDTPDIFAVLNSESIV